MAWHHVCAVNDVDLDRGVCAYILGEQIAIFRVSPLGQLFAVCNYDPYAVANVLSRGIIGSEGDIVYICSPIYKNRWNLATGEGLDTNSRIITYPIRRRNGCIEVELAHG